MIMEEKTIKASNLDVLILCGGLGSRLHSVISDRPKGLALIKGQPFLDILVETLVKSGFQRFIFCVGHLKEQIVEHFESRKEAKFLFSEESFPLGTGGAIKNAIPLVTSDTLLVINGDSYCTVDYEKLIQFHNERNSSATFVLSKSPARDDGGRVLIDYKNRVEHFHEKNSTKEMNGSFINAGIYLLKQDSIKATDLEPPFSLEYDFFPSLINSKSCYAFITNSQLVDIGTPERYLDANKHLRIPT